MSKADPGPDAGVNPLLDPLRAELLREMIREQKAEAEMREIDLEVRKDQERDRQVKPGRIRVLTISGVITPQAADNWIDALQHWELRDPGEPIVVQINSPGGSVTDGLAIYDTLMRLRRKGHHVTTHGSGLVASMASVLLQAGDERILDARAKMMLHEGAIVVGGGMGGTALTPGEREDLEQFSKLLTNDMVDILTERSKLTRRQLAAKWKRKDWWLTADDALKAGLVDKVE